MGNSRGVFLSNAFDVWQRAGRFLLVLEVRLSEECAVEGVRRAVSADSRSNLRGVLSSGGRELRVVFVAKPTGKFDNKLIVF